MGFLGIRSVELILAMTKGRRRLIRGAALAVAIVFAVPRYAAAEIVITINKSVQRLSVTVDGAPKYEWPIPTARRGYRTPNGMYRPEWLARKWFSRKYDWSPMPYSIFFDGGYAIHWSYEISPVENAESCTLIIET